MRITMRLLYFLVYSIFSRLCKKIYASKLERVFKICPSWTQFLVIHPYFTTRPGHNQGSHWRCDYVTDLVFQEKSYKTNLHLFSAHAGVVWRSVNKNNCSREVNFSERWSYMVICIPFFMVTAFHFEFTHCSTSCHLNDRVLIIE